MNAVADFRADNDWSKRISYMPFWQAIFKKAFAGYASHAIVADGDHWAQAGGVDFIVSTQYGQTYYVDQKARKDVWFCRKCFPGQGKSNNEEDCLRIMAGARSDCPACGGQGVSDILVEYTSNDKRRTPGWAAKPLLCDFLAYTFVPIRRCYMLPVVPLQRAWAQFGQDWLSKYSTKSSPNYGYSTLNCPVPLPVLFRAMNRCSIITWDSIDQEPPKINRPAAAQCRAG